MIISTEDQADALNEIRATTEFAHCEDDPLRGRFGRTYYSAVFRDQFRDTSFAVEQSGKPLLLISCSVNNDRVTDFDMPIRLVCADGVGAKAYASSVREAIDHLKKISETHQAREFLVEEPVVTGEMSVVGTALHSAGAGAKPFYNAAVDLTCDEALLTRNLRKSYRSLVNWGKRNLKLEYANQANPDPDLLQSFRDLHRKVAGFVTRSDETWQIQFERIIAGEGELVLGALEDGTYVSGTLVIDGRSRSVYVSAAYDHDHFDKPLGHWPLFASILNARSRGMKWFDLGHIPARPNVDKRGFNVGRFKKGFVSAPQLYLVWLYSLASH